MQRVSMLSLLLATACIGGQATVAHPIGKVITLLQDLSAKVKSEGRAEEVAFESFVYWCKTSSAELNDAIQEEKDTIDTLESTIESKTKETGLLTGDIAELADEMLSLQAADKTAVEDNESRNKLYLEKEKDLKSTIKAMDDAVKALEEASKSTDAKLLLSQHKLAQDRVRNTFALIATVATEGEQSSLMDFVQDSADPIAAAGDNKKHAKKYSFKSSSVTELLKNLKMKFEDDLVEATKEETNAQNSYALSKNARDATVTATESSKKQKETDLADTTGALKTAQGDLKDQEADLKADGGSLQATKSSCSMKNSEWQERSAIRKQELAAMAAGIRILSKVSGVRTEAPSNPGLPAAPGKVFLQMVASPQTRVVQLLKATAKTYHSKALDRLAAEVSTHVPAQFQDIINQVQKMIFRLKQEQTDEDNHKLWCDEELAKTQGSMDNKQDKVTELKAKIKEANANVATLTSDIVATEKMMADIKKYQKEATEIRNTGKHENTVAMKDSQEAQKALTNAMSVLNAFYKESGEITKEPWEFLQQQAPVSLPKDPALWDAPYTGTTDPTKASTGVIAVLEAVSADFMKMEADTRAQEVTDAKEYDNTMKKHNIELARRSKESEMKGAQKQRLVAKITALTKQEKHVSDEHASTVQYMSDLQPACVNGDSTYVDRKAARDAEIKALGEAQDMLDQAFSASKPAKTFLQIVSKHA